MKPKLTSTSLEAAHVPQTVVISPPAKSVKTTRHNFMKQHKLEQRVKNQKIIAI